MSLPLVDITREVLEDIVGMVGDLNSFLESCGVPAPDRSTLLNTIERVKQLKVKLNTKDYVGFLVDSNGYIIKVFDLADFEESSKVPDNVDAGYYKYVDGEFVIDYERKRQLED